MHSLVLSIELNSEDEAVGSVFVDDDDGLLISRLDRTARAVDVDDDNDRDSLAIKADETGFSDLTLIDIF